MNHSAFMFMSLRSQFPSLTFRFPSSLIAIDWTKTFSWSIKVFLISNLNYLASFHESFLTSKRSKLWKIRSFRLFMSFAYTIMMILQTSPSPRHALIKLSIRLLLRHEMVSSAVVLWLTIKSTKYTLKIKVNTLNCCICSQLPLTCTKELACYAYVLVKLHIVKQLSIY